jgi:hypothetical protein
MNFRLKIFTKAIFCSLILCELIPQAHSDDVLSPEIGHPTIIDIAESKNVTIGLSELAKSGYNPNDYKTAQVQMSPKDIFITFFSMSKEEARKANRKDIKEVWVVLDTTSKRLQYIGPPYLQ